LAEETAARETAALAALAREGDRAAFDGLYRRYAPMVHAILLSTVSSRELDDLVQDVFLAAWRGIERLRDADQVGAWLGTIARNRGLAARRRQPSRAELPDGLADRPRDEGEEILSVLQTLPEAYREPLTMRLVEGMTGPEIAAATGLTHGSVRVNLHRGMKLLREKLREKGWS
jgi:RNA polymerase sigma-70 factor (ECF subfamily)